MGLSKDATLNVIYFSHVTLDLLQQQHLFGEGRMLQRKHASLCFCPFVHKTAESGSQTGAEEVGLMWVPEGRGQRGAVVGGGV